MASSSPHTRYSAAAIGLLASLGCLILPVVATADGAPQERAEPTRDGVLLLVERLGTDESPGFRVDFDRPLQIVADPTTGAASQFQLRLRPVRTIATPMLQNAITWKPDPSLPLKFLELDVTPAREVIMTLSFSMPVQLRPEQDGRLESMSFLVTPTSGSGQPAPATATRAANDTVIRPPDAAEAKKNRERVTEAHRAISIGEYDKALGLLGRIRDTGTPDQVRFATEFSGVALERSGRTDLAAAQYRKFLETYPQSPEKARVEQRLAALDGATNLSRSANRTRQMERARRERNDWSTSGSVNNTYRYSRNVDDSGNAYEAISMLGVDADLSSRHRSHDMEWQLRMSGGHYEDMRSGGDGSTDRIRYLSIGAATSDRDYGMLFGRQRSYGGGILSRYDGVSIYARTSEHSRVNLVAGFPVNTTEQTFLEDSRSLYGFNVDLDDILDGFDVNAFFIRQDSDGLLDREAVGTEINYAAGRSSMYGMVDYDVHFGELNAATVSGNHLFASKSRVNWALNIRKSPYLSTTNALYGQGVITLEDLRDLLTDDEIEDLANDRTRDSKSASLSLSQPLSERFDLSGSVTWLDLSETPASGGVPAYDGTGGQYYVDMRLSGQRLFGQRDLSFIGVRYNTLETADIWSFYANSRLPWGERLSLNPRVRVDHRDNANGTSQWNLSPGFRLQYQTRRHLLYTEAGMVYYRTDYPELDSQEFKTYFAFLGYRLAY